MGEFYDRVYDVVRQIPKGKVATYGQIAFLAGKPRGSQRVGFALHANKDPFIIPCYRVVNRFGELAKSFKFGGAEVQKQMLQNDGIVVDENNVVDLEKYRWSEGIKK